GETRRDCPGPWSAGIKEWTGSNSPRVPAVRTRPRNGSYQRQHLALADGNGSQRPDIRTVLETDSALAREHIARSRDDQSQQGHVSSGRSHPLDCGSLEQKIRADE